MSVNSISCFGAWSVWLGGPSGGLGGIARRKAQSYKLGTNVGDGGQAVPPGVAAGNCLASRGVRSTTVRLLRRLAAMLRSEATSMILSDCLPKSDPTLLGSVPIVRGI
jgi:hypothetical protein